MTTIPVCVGWLWFLGYDIEYETPNYSILSKARFRWGVNAFKTFLKTS